MAEKSLLDKAKMPIGKDVKKRLDNWLNENVNVPLAKKGYSDTGAALSAALSAGGELLIPDDLADAAIAMVPGARLAKAGAKGMKALKKVKPGLEKAGTIDYGAIKKAEDAAAQAKRDNFEKMAETLEYSSGTPVRKRPNPMDTELRQLEKKKSGK